MAKVAFVLAAAQGSSMILNRLDYEPGGFAGVGIDLLEEGERCVGLGVIVGKLLVARRQSHGDGVVLIDGGANIGSFTVPWAQLMRGWGRVIAFEPQQWPYYALCGNIVLNNCFNAEARRQALGHSLGSIGVPSHDPLIPFNSGGTQLGEGEHVEMISIDSLKLPRLDLLKLDLEGMEPDALAGARDTIARLQPFVMAEIYGVPSSETCAGRIAEALPDYAMVSIGSDMLCVPPARENVELISAMMRLAGELNMREAV